MSDPHEEHEHHCEVKKELDRMSEREVWLEFVDTCSICGLAHCTAKNKVRARLWVLVVIAAFFCFGGHFYLMLSNYLEYPLNAESEVHTSGFQFPDVTLCVKHPFDQNRLSKQDLGIHKASNFWQYVIQKSANRNFSKDVLQTFGDRFAMLSFRKYAELHSGYIDIIDRISRCSYKGKKCAKHYFSDAKMSNKLNCVTFHPADREITHLGPEEGLHLTIDTGEGFEVTDNIKKLYQSNGYEITLHENGTEPDFKKLLYFAQGGQEHDISMTMSIYQKFPTRYKPCLGEIITDVWAVNLNAPEEDQMHYRRTRDTCKMLEYQRTSIEKCGCWRDDFLIPISESFGKNAPLCHELPYEIYFNEGIDLNTGELRTSNSTINLNEDNELYKDVVKRFRCFQKLKETSEYNKLEHCYHNCESIIYQNNMAVSKYDFDIDNYIKLYESIFRKFKMRESEEKIDPEQMRRDLGNGSKVLTIKVYAVDLDVLYTEESLAYPLTAFVSDFGGNIGLWIGCTVITLAEVVELFIRLGYVKFKNVKQGDQRKNSTKKNDSGEKGNEEPETINLTSTA